MDERAKIGFFFKKVKKTLEILDFVKNLLFAFKKDPIECKKTRQR